MPPPLVDSDAESNADNAMDTVTDHVRPEIAQMKNEYEIRDEKASEENDGGEGDDDDDEDEDEEVYIVEKIQDHRSDFEDGKMRYLVKWKGYEAKKDRTWEPEENLEGARDVLTEYWKSAESKSTAGADKKRGRPSASAKPETETKTKRQRLSKDVGDDEWKPPIAKDGSWDSLVQSVDTVIRENEDGELWGYLIWNEQDASGKYYRSKAKLTVIYKACPQRMLHFYEKHLVFSNADNGE